MNTPPLPLQSVRVVDLTHAWAGPFATKLLADLGAEVIKIESATHPDVLRLWAPAASLQGPAHELNPWFQTCNTNKLSCSLELETELGRDLFLQLVAVSDVVIDNFSARVMANLGLDYQRLRQVKEDVIALSMPAYGMTGPYAHYVGYGEAVESIAGLTMLNGYPDKPIRLGIAVVDVLASFAAVQAVIAALIHRQRSGQGQFIDVSHFEAACRVIGEQLIAYQFTGQQPQRLGHRHPAFAPQGCYPCAGDDEWVVISVRTDRQWLALKRLLDSPALDDQSLEAAEERQARHTLLDTEISRWTRQRDKREVMRLCQEAGVPAAAVAKPGDVVRDPQLSQRGFLEQVQHPVAGPVWVEGPTFLLSGTPRPTRSPAPLFGQHTDYVLRQLLGKSEDEIALLREQGVVGRPLSSTRRETGV